jgi:hypothetical protein
MRERPILFSGSMIRALLAGRKTVTRRVVKPQPAYEASRDLWTWQNAKALASWSGSGAPVACALHHGLLPHCPYGLPGDRLWVRETWAPVDFLADGYELEDPNCVGYRADLVARRHYASGSCALNAFGWNWAKVKWHPSIFMPRWASRLTLEILSVRVERLQDISEEDAIAEGVVYRRGVSATHRHEFQRLWEHINGADSWQSNPWCWAISFRRVEAPRA